MTFYGTRLKNVEKIMEKINLLEKIVEVCVGYGIPVSVDLSPFGGMAYRVSGFSKSGEALIYNSEDGGHVICATRYDRKDDLLTFTDLIHVAHDWYQNYKDRSPFEHPEPYWQEVFRDFSLSFSRKIVDVVEEVKPPHGYDREDLPF